MARILIAEDEDSNRRLLKDALELDSHEVVEATDGVDALEKLAGASLDLVITDVLMPRKGGIDLIRELRWSNPRVKILAIAAMGDTVLSEAREAGADRTMQKPFHLTDMLAVVRELLAEPA